MTTPRDRLNEWILQISREALAVDAIAATEVIRALTGGYDFFTPQAFSAEQLHNAGAAFLRIARL
jgi:hypothetical protein